jgi:acetylornithine deacetylase/succinyl-diaminopimelate desuccinylase-like protein
MEVLSVDGYPPITKTSNIINPKIGIRVSIRLPPTRNHLEARAAAEQELYKTPAPYNCVLEHIDSISDGGFDSPANPPELTDVFEQASQVVFGKKHLSMGQGGSIPFMNFLREKWPAAKFVVTGLLGPESNAHGPNECLRFDYLKKLTACFSQIIARSIPVNFHSNVDPSEEKECGKSHGHNHHHGHGHGKGH